MWFSLFCQVRAEYRQIFLEMGFTEMPTNNFVESSFWNFDALFQPQQHPARYTLKLACQKRRCLRYVKFKLNFSGTLMTHFSFPNLLRLHFLRKITWKRFKNMFCICFDKSKFEGEKNPQ